MKEVQRKIQQDVTHLGEPKAKTEAVLKQIQEEQCHIETLKKEPKKLAGTNRKRSIRLHYPDRTKCPETTNREGCKELHITDRSTRIG